MADKKEENNNLPLPATPEAGQRTAPVSETPAKPCPPAAERPMSKGEEWFEDFFYTKMNYWLNLGMSLLVTDFFTHEGKGFFTRTGAGKRMLENGSQRLAKATEVLGIASAEKALSSTRAGLKTLALNSGGWLLVLPLFFAERNKRAIVHWKNKQLGVNQRAPDGHEETPEEIYIVDEQPVNPGVGGFLKDAAKIIGRRTLASGSTIVTGIVLDKIATTKNPLTNETIYGQDRITGLITDMTNNAVKLSKVPGNEKFVKSEFVQRYLGFAALDSIYTWMTATVMYLTNGSRKEKEPKEIEEEYVSSAPNPKPPSRISTDRPAQPASFRERLGERPANHTAAASATPEDPLTLGA